MCYSVMKNSRTKGLAATSNHDFDFLGTRGMQASTTTISSRAQKPLRGTLARCAVRVCRVCDGVLYFVEQ